MPRLEVRVFGSTSAYVIPTGPVSIFWPWNVTALLIIRRSGRANATG